MLDSRILAQRGHYGAVTGGLGFLGLIRLVHQVVNIEDLSTSIDSNLDPHGIMCIIWYFDDWIKHSHRSCSVSGAWARGGIKTRILQKIDQLIYCIGFYAVSAIFFSHITAAESFEISTINPFYPSLDSTFAKCGCIWLCSSGEDFKYHQCIFAIIFPPLAGILPIRRKNQNNQTINQAIIFPCKRCYPWLHFNKRESPSYKDALYQVWFKLAMGNKIFKFCQCIFAVS